MQSNLRTAALLFLVPALSQAARSTPDARRAFEQYVAGLEMRLPDRAPAPGEVRVEAVHGGSWQVAGGLLHHWRATALVPGATPQDLLALLRDYDHLARYYAPEVVSSRTLGGAPSRANLAMRFRKQKVVTVVLDAEFDAESGMTGPARGYSVSRSTHIWQVENAGSARERRQTEGDDDGYLWRLNSYWNFEQRPEGLLMQCEAVSLTRDVPAGLGWLILPIIQTLPKASLEFTMTATRNALAANRRRENDDCAN